MTLTEEQREALDYVLEYMIDDPNDDRDANLASSIKIIRDMIDSGDHIPDDTKMVGFDLGRARGLRDFLQDDCSEVGDVWGEMIAEIERLRADLEQSEICILARLEVIEQLQTENEELQESLTEAYLLGSHKKAKELAPRIAELEDALVEERAKQFDVDEPCPARTHHKYCDMWKQCPRTEGKIGPDARPRSWQITDERKAVILHCKRMLTFLKEDDAPCYDVEKITKDESVLVAMLEEADHDKP